MDSHVKISEATSINLQIISDDAANAPALSASDQALIDQLAPGNAQLVSFQGPKMSFLLDSDLTEAGRESKADIILDDMSVSRKHVHFIRRDGKFYLADVGSLNGTYLNDILRDEECALQTGDKIQIGKFRFIFYASSH